MCFGAFICFLHCCLAANAFLGNCPFPQEWRCVPTYGLRREQDITTLPCRPTDDTRMTWRPPQAKFRQSSTTKWSIPKVTLSVSIGQANACDAMTIRALRALPACQAAALATG